MMSAKAQIALDNNFPGSRYEDFAMQLTGIHHLTAISARPRDNLAFYTGLLGMRLVKKTVNQDDVSAYHLFYADGEARPGTDLTFFDFPAAPERRGTNSISRTGLRVAGEKTLEYWRNRLKAAGGVTGDVIEVDGRLTLPFEDGEGQRPGAGRRRRHGNVLAMGEEPGAAKTPDPRPRPDRAHRARPCAHRVRADRGHEHAPRRATMPRTARTFTCLRWARAAPPPNCMCSKTGIRPPRARAPAACTTSRSARRTRRSITPGRSAWVSWGVPNSGEIDRFYFRSLYFREPNGILFEIATDGPGFADRRADANARRKTGAAAVPGAAAQGDRGGAEAAG